MSEQNATSELEEANQWLARVKAISDAATAGATGCRLAAASAGKTSFNRGDIHTAIASFELAASTLKQLVKD